MESIKQMKLPHNAPGKYYTTEECDGCAYCAAVAPEIMNFDKATNTYYVSRQPANEDEEELMQEAVEDCPVDAIEVYHEQGGWDKTREVQYSRP
jgi:ferredoxin